MRISFEKRAQEMELLPPRLWGVAWHDYARAETVFYPIPLNYLWRFWRRVLFWWDRRRAEPSWVDQQIAATLKASEATAWLEGFNRGQDVGWNKCLDQLTKARQELETPEENAAEPMKDGGRFSVTIPPGGDAVIHISEEESSVEVNDPNANETEEGR